MENALVLVFSFFFGTAVGSFLNVVLMRYGRARIGFARSRCRSCARILAWYELIPVVSFVFLKGRCRSCRKKLSWQYPLVELFMGGVAAVLAWVFLPDLPGYSAWLYTLFSVMVLIGLYDLAHKEIPNAFSAALFVITVLGALIFFRDTIGVRVLTGGILAGFFMLLYLLSRGRWVGGGDIKISLPLGMLAGWPGVLVLFMATYLLGLTAACLLLLGRRASLKSEIPFAPFLLAGTIIAFLWGPLIIRWYETLFLSF